MCLAVPMQIQSVQHEEAHCAVRGVSRSVSLVLLQDMAPQPGDWVLVHVGHAIQLITPEDALETWDLLDEWTAQQNQEL
ncbi:MAG: hypothetical protein RIQ52_402 [Pseudomonadota bacterium]|jgi:hydrogenase expression/formation protein HypC